MAYTFKHGDRPLENFTIQRAIGRGGFGEVYYAVSDGGREVALKYLKENPHVELRGVSNCINLKSPYLVSIFDVKKNADGEYFIIMEYCSGPSLRDLLIAEPKGFAPEKAAFFCREISKGLAYLHDRGIVHRDLKPGNIFFDDGYVKIGDYGLSKFIAVSRHSAQTASVGTVHYMAPEIGSGDYSKGVDIYAMGVMLYEMVLGKVPFEGSSMAEVLMKHLTTQPELDELSPQFGKVIRKALQKDPKDRYQSVEEMIDDLLIGEDIQKSLAGFSTKSLEGAVRAGGRDRFDSPVPSPNPPNPGRPDHLRSPGRVSPLGAEGALPSKLARKMDALSRKIDTKINKLRQSPRLPGSPPPLPATDTDAERWGVPIRARKGGKQKVLLLGLLTLLLSIGLVAVVGTMCDDEEKGASAGMLVWGLYLGLVIGRRATRWFSVQDGPVWAQRLIRAACCAPFLAIGCIPLFEGNDSAGAVFLGLLALAVFKNWENEEDVGSDGEIHVGTLFGTAITALIFTAIAGGITNNDPEEVMFLAAGVAAAVALILQAGAWWVVHQRGRAARAEGAQHDTDDARDEEVTRAGIDHCEMGRELSAFIKSEYEQPATASPALSERPLIAAPWVDNRGRRPRALIPRVFWSMISFGLMGGAIVTFLYPLIARPRDSHDITNSILLCIGFAAMSLFTLRKTTPLRQPGFWRETFRPFLISVSLFGIGATTTAIAREWDHKFPSGCIETDSLLARDRATVRHELKARALGMIVEVPEPPDRPGEQWDYHYEKACEYECLDDEGKTAVMGGLVMSSITFVGLTFFTGRNPRRGEAPEVQQAA